MVTPGPTYGKETRTPSTTTFLSRSIRMELSLRWTIRDLAQVSAMNVELLQGTFSITMVNNLLISLARMYLQLPSKSNHFPSNVL